jgi:hypothetical protein
MSTVEFVRAYIHRLCRQLGTNADSIYNAKTGAWYFSRGSSTIEAFLTNVGDNEETGRIFFRCIAPIFTINVNPVRQFELFQKVLELNTRHMGIKLALVPDQQLICVISERDIEGMDYGEFITVISDISYWAGYFEKTLKDQFGTT